MTGPTGAPASVPPTLDPNQPPAGTPGQYNTTTSNPPPGSVVTAGLGNNTVNLGAGDYQVNFGGYNDILVAGDGNHAIGGSLGNATITTGFGYQTITAGGYNNQIHVGGNAGGSGFTVIDAGLGNETVTAGSGNNAILAGGYGDTVTVGGGVNYIFGTPGAAGSSIGGNATVTLGDTPGILSQDWVFLAGYGNTVNLSAGVNTVTSGLGNDTFHVAAAGGTLDIAGFAASDRIVLSDFLGAGAYSLTAVTHATDSTVAAGDTRFDLTSSANAHASVLIEGLGTLDTAYLLAHAQV